MLSVKLVTGDNTVVPGEKRVLVHGESFSPSSGRAGLETLRPAPGSRETGLKSLAALPISIFTLSQCQRAKKTEFVLQAAFVFPNKRLFRL